MSTQAFEDPSAFEELSRRLASHGQQHLLHFWQELSPGHQQRLAAQLRAVDIAAIAELFRHAADRSDWTELAARADPPQAIRLNDPSNKFSVAEARKVGENALRRGKVGAILVAGGQGTRLGFDHPKGMYSIGPVSNASLFQILFEKLLAVSRRFGATIPLYVMTSDATHVETEDYLKAKNYFGLPASEVRLFCQGVMPAVDAATGRILLSAKGHVALNPDGHGGMLAALDRTAGLADIERRGLAQLFYFQVDNPLVEMCDPALLGYHILCKSEMTTLAIAKHEPSDRLGNLVRIDGQTRIIEYSDFPDPVASQRNPDGTLRFWAGSIAIHVFDAAFLSRASRDSQALPFHVARKKVAFVDEQGNRVEPTQPNAIKFERFIFDLLPLAGQSIAVEGAAAHWFAPVKNPPGERSESPDTCRAALIALHRQWLTAAGANVAPDVPVEIGPLFALDAAELRAKIPPGTTIDKPTYLR
ncbi:MAG TPA: UTP--glucose-1-phosphate uridylyltransferase [Pirellulales bacterium]|nr:UTP--glucose-1-phosphate uridylyltransferase [Pirellulales bacterium]